MTVSLRAVGAVVFCFLMSAAGSAQAVAPVVSKNAKTAAERAQTTKAMRAYFTEMLPLLHTTDQLPKLVSVDAMTQSDREAYLKDYANIAHEDLPKMSLQHDEFYINGSPSGLKITSYEPFQLSLGGKKLTYSSKLSPLKNYQAIVKFLSEPRHTAYLSLFDEAQADSIIWDYTKRAAGAVSSLAWSATTSSASWAYHKTWGAWVVAPHQDSGIDKLLSSSTMQVDCDDKFVTIFDVHQNIALKFIKSSRHLYVSLNYRSKISDTSEQTSPGDPIRTSFIEVEQASPQENGALGPLMTCGNAGGVDSPCEYADLQLCFKKDDPTWTRKSTLDCQQKVINDMRANNNKCDYATAVRSAFLAPTSAPAPSTAK